MAETRRSDTAAQVFISWSGRRSRALAGILEEYLTTCLPDLRFVLSESLPRGTLWPQEILGLLRSSAGGIVLLNPRVLGNPWLTFEAGVLAGLEDSLIIPVCFDDLSIADLAPPLGLFNAVKADQDGFAQLLRSLATRLTPVGPSSDEAVDRLATQWPSMRDRIAHLPLDDAASISGAEERLPRIFGRWEGEAQRDFQSTLGPQTRCAAVISGTYRHLVLELVGFGLDGEIVTQSKTVTVEILIQEPHPVLVATYAVTYMKTGETRHGAMRLRILSGSMGATRMVGEYWGEGDVSGRIHIWRDRGAEERSDPSTG